LRQAGEGVEPVAPDVPETAATPRKGKAKAVAKVRKPCAKKASPRLRARWGVFDGTMRQVAVFDCNQRAADDKFADLRSKRKGPYFLQIVKEPMPEPSPDAAIA
jgi:hypothetical protein